MAGVILENLSTKKLVPICILLMAFSLTCFIIGGKLVPDPVHTQNAIGNWCKRQFVNNTEVKWYPSRGKQPCDRLDGPDDKRISTLRAEDIVFSFQYPLPRDNEEKLMSRWFMYHFAIVNFNIEYKQNNNPGENAKLKLIVSVGYKDDPKSDQWLTLHHEREVDRTLQCAPPSTLKDGYRWECDFIDLFEFGSMPHKQYLVNIRLPPNPQTGDNINIGYLSGIDLVWFAQTGGFTLYFMVMKTVFFAMILPLTIWNYKRVSDLNRPAVFLEKLSLTLAISALLLNLPIDWLTLVIEMKFMLLWSDIRQGLFLTVLLCYWVVFASEHMMDDVKRGQLSSYYKQLSFVMFASALMFVFDICERGIRIMNPFFTLWASATGTKVAKAFLGLAVASAIIYFLTLAVIVIKAIYNIWKKKSQFKFMAKGLQVHYMSIIYRFYFALMFSVVCSILTVAAFAMGQIYESRWRWELDDEVDVDEVGVVDGQHAWDVNLKDFKVTTAFQLGVYGTWNVYVMVMLIFYAPSHKQAALPVDADGNEEDERVELTSLSSGPTTRSRSAAAVSTFSTEDATDETVNLTSGQQVSDQHQAQIHSLSSRPSHLD